MVIGLGLKGLNSYPFLNTIRFDSVKKQVLESMIYIYLFIFRYKDIGEFKSFTAAKAAKSTNQQMNIGVTKKTRHLQGRL